jgi:uncharacterized protein (TIGR02145 family)
MNLFMGIIRKDKMKKTLLMAALAAAVVGGALGCGGGKSGVKPAPSSVSTFTDKRDGKVYRIVEIGGAVWMAENLNYAAEGSVCYENKAGNCAKYGRLYNWYTAMKACPAGTHLSSDEEWKALVNYAGGREKAGTKLKSSKGWESEKGVPAGTNEYDFSALPGGVGYSDGRFYNADSIGIWWNAFEFFANSARCRLMGYGYELVHWGSIDKTYLFSVRCVADKEAQK